jgi:hypothetical protein
MLGRGRSRDERNPRKSHTLGNPITSAIVAVFEQVLDAALDSINDPSVDSEIDSANYLPSTLPRPFSYFP